MTTVDRAAPRAGPAGSAAAHAVAAGRPDGPRAGLRPPRAPPGPRVQDGRAAVRPPRALDPRLRAPVFVLGAPRSGTTFLGSCIGALPEVSYHFEPRVTKAAARMVLRGHLVRAARGPGVPALLPAAAARRRRRRPAVRREEPGELLRRPVPGAHLPRRPVRPDHPRRPGRRRLARREAVAVGRSRPAPASAAAAVRRGGRGRAGGWSAERADEFDAASDLTRTAWSWRRFTAAARAALAELPADRVLTVRYEDVVQRPGGGRSHDRGVLRARGGPGVAAGRPGAPPTRARSAGGGRRWTPRAWPTSSARPAPLLRELGYDAVTRVTADVPTGGLLVTGLPRSGTSWVGKMLEASGEVVYVNEPMNPQHPPGHSPGVLDARVTPPVPVHRRGRRRAVAPRLRADAGAALPASGRSCAQNRSAYDLARMAKYGTAFTAGPRCAAGGRCSTTRSPSSPPAGWCEQMGVDGGRPRARPGVVRRQLARAGLEDPLPRAARAARAGARPPRRPTSTGCGRWSARRTGWPAPACCGRRPTTSSTARSVPIPGVHLIGYESLVQDPMGGFADLYRRFGLTWSDDAAGRVREATTEKDGRRAGLAPLVAARRAVPHRLPPDGRRDGAVDLPDRLTDAEVERVRELTADVAARVLPTAAPNGREPLAGRLRDAQSREQRPAEQHRARTAASLADVAAEQPARLVDQPEEPLEAERPHPAGARGRGRRRRRAARRRSRATRCSGSSLGEAL